MKRIRYYARELRNSKKYVENLQYEESQLDIISGELIRNVHSIEKGLSIECPRLGFGHARQEEMMKQIEYMEKSTNSYHQEACRMAIDAIGEYLEYHEQYSYSDDFIKNMRKFWSERSNKDGKKYGGTIELKKEELQFDREMIESFFNTRHSIRDFDSKPVDEDVLKKAMKLAQRTPSACNRQGVRAYVFNQSDNNNLAKMLAGVGGFADSVSRFICITAKTSVYRLEESHQYIVSASMYAAYLTLTLHLYGLGACVIQRPVIWTKEWQVMKDKFDFPRDEQIICLLAVGNLKDSCKVPLSHRLEEDNMIHFL